LVQACHLRKDACDSLNARGHTGEQPRGHKKKMKKHKTKKKLNKTRTAPVDATAKFLAESKQALGGEPLGLTPQTPLQTDGSFRVVTVDE